MFIALPLAIVGAKFEAAYKRVYSIEDTCETVSAVQRRQLVLNGAYGMCTRIQAGRDAFTRMKQAFAQGVFDSVEFSGTDLPARMKACGLILAKVGSCWSCSHILVYPIGRPAD